MWNKGWDTLFEKREWGRFPELEVVRFVMRHFGDADRQSCRLLEIGCGPGANLMFMAAEGFDAYGIDGSEVAINQARHRMTGQKLQAALEIGDVTELPYEDETFDAVIDCECLYANNLVSTALILDETKRVLKPGGKFLSITFATGTYGDGLGERVDGEPNTYSRLHEGALHSDYGLTRFTDFDEIENIYGKNFHVDSVESIVRTLDQRAHEIREWIIICTKEVQKS